MKKVLALVIAAALAFTPVFGSAAAAAKKVNYYDQSGNAVTVAGMYYNSEGRPAFNDKCYYLDADGSRVYVGGREAYCYDADGNLTAGRFCYDASGKVIPRPASNTAGCCGHRL